MAAINNHIHWYDLSRHGFSLKIVPKTSLRKTMICLDVIDTGLQEQFSADIAAKTKFTEALDKLAFNPMPLNNGQNLRYFSKRTQYSFDDLQTLCPALVDTDCREMPVSEVVANFKDGAIGEWSEFARVVLSEEAKGVWVPTENPYLGSTKKLEYAMGSSHPTLNKNLLVSDHSIIEKLNAAFYAQNILIPYYLDLEDALADGYPRDKVMKADLPYALPLYVTSKSAVIAIQDIRYVGEIMDKPPNEYYEFNLNGTAGFGIVTRALRAIKQHEHNLDQVGGKGESQGTQKHEDVGEKIGGARKDFSKRAMVYDDLEIMNDHEKKSLVVKNNIWPPLNYQEMRERGVSPQAAMAIKVLKDSLNSAPTTIRNQSNSDEAYEEYVKAVTTVMESMRTTATLSDFRQATESLYRASKEGESGGTSTIYGTPMQRQWGEKASWIIFDSANGYSLKINREIRRKVEWYQETDDQNILWRALIKPKKQKTDPEKEKEKKQNELYRELEFPHLEHVKRDGNDWRNGADIDGDFLMQHFGFRAIEYGNWLPQNERQAVLNMAYDSLSDLASMLELPPNAVSFNGSLAIAFGSRGHGGKRAAKAHFEPARFVINLTRINGSGSLAHEWFHALDYYLGGMTCFSSETRHENRLSSMSKLAQSLVKRGATLDEIMNSSSSEASRGIRNALSWLYQQPTESRQAVEEKINMLVEKAKYKFNEASIEAIQRRIDQNPHFKESGIIGIHAVHHELIWEMKNELSTAIESGCENKKSFKKVKKHIDNNVNYLLNQLSKWATANALNDLNINPPLDYLAHYPRHTEYYEQALKLDKKRSKPYWGTVRELFARAGAAYVQDKLDSKAQRSDYLVYGADEARYTDHPVGNPNPASPDRKEFYKLYEGLFDQYRLVCIDELEKNAEAEINLS